jgi:DNA-binding MarR family transcriptional regulator
MNLSDLHRLGRLLVDTSRRAMTPADLGVDLSAADLAVIRVLFERDTGATISELTEQTGFAQSRVSASVAALRDLGWVTTATGAVDRRRTQVSLKPGVRIGIAATLNRSPDVAMAELVDGLSATKQRQVTAALEILIRYHAHREKQS